MLSSISRLLLLLPLSLLAGCQTLGYYGQMLDGHFDIIAARQPINELIDDPGTDDELRQRLITAREARVFASAELGLPDNDSYLTYVDTGRPFVNWNVVAAGEFELSPKTWCFPVAGCVSYRGYYAEEAAHRYGKTLEDEGWDVAYNGAAAYSTLGWFDDPLLNTMLRGDQLWLVGLIFHELAHQQLYVQDDSDFNEAFATFVELEGVRRWLAARGEAELNERYAARLARREDFFTLLGELRAELAPIYDGTASAAEKRRAKAAAFDQLQQRYRQLRDVQWGGYAGYDRWFDRSLNNAHIVAVATYFRWVPAFAALSARHEDDLGAFYSAVAELAEQPKARRDERLQTLLEVAR